MPEILRLFAFASRNEGSVYVADRLTYRTWTPTGGVAFDFLSLVPPAPTRLESWSLKKSNKSGCIGMLSPSLDSPQRPFAALAGPSSVNPPRVVQKCVARVKGTSRGAIYTLYLRLALPPSTTTQTFPLLPDDQVKLRSSAVYAVRPGSDPQSSKETSQGFKRAASILGLQTGIHADDFTIDAAASTAETKPRITTSNFHISLVQPPVSAASTVKQIRLVVLQLEVGLVAMPPTSPYIVMLPTPRCLNNRLHFDLETKGEDDDAFADGVVVEVDPPLVPRSRSEESAEKRAEKSQEGDGNAGDLTVVSGPFPSTDKVLIRWASPSAAASSTSVAGLHSLRGTRLRSSLDMRFVGMDDEGARAILKVSMRATLEGVTFPGLDPTAYLGLSLITPLREAKWSSHSIQVHSTNPMALQDWTLSLGEGPLQESRPEEPISRSSSSSAGSLLAASVSSRAESIDGDTTGDEEANLADVRPPKGLVTPELDFSFDRERFDDVGPGRASRGRRHSIGVRGGQQGRLSSLKDEAEDGHESTLYLLTNVASVCRQSHSPTDFTFAAEGQVSVPCRREDKHVVVEVPALVGHGLATSSSVRIFASQLEVLEWPETSTEAQSQEGCVTFASTWTPHQDARRDGSLMVKALPFMEEDPEDEDGDVSGTTIATARLSKGARALSPLSPDASGDLLAAPTPHLNDVLDLGPSAEQLDDLWTSSVSEANVEVWCPSREATVAESHRRTLHRLVLSWPCSPPRSDASHGTLLPKLVVAVPNDPHSTVHILHASVDGIALNAQAEKCPKQGTSHIIDLELPSGTRRDAQLKALLIYHVDASPAAGEDARHCIVPPVASSIALLRITVYNCSSTPLLSFAEEPFHWAISQNESAHQISKATVFMLPAMSTTFMTIPSVAPVSLDVSSIGPKRRREREGSAATLQRSRGSALGVLSVTHLLWTLLLSLALLGTVANLEPAVSSLSRKVETLAVALDVDFREGTWRPEDSSSDHVVDVDDDDDLGSWLPPADASSVPERTFENKQLSKDTTSFAQALHLISVKFMKQFAAGFSWPVRLLIRLFGR